MSNRSLAQRNDTNHYYYCNILLHPFKSRVITFDSTVFDTIGDYMWPVPLERKLDFEDFWYYILEVSMDDMKIQIFPNVV